MEKFDIQKIVETFAPNIEELSKVLFPHIKYPKQALDRVLRKEANLDSAQIEVLASYLGVLVSDLFSIDDWRGSWSTEHKCLVFIKGVYQVNINYGGSFITVYKDGKVISQEVKQTVNMTMPEFIQHINTLIQ